MCNLNHFGFILKSKHEWIPQSHSVPYSICPLVHPIIAQELKTNDKLLQWLKDNLDLKVFSKLQYCRDLVPFVATKKPQNEMQLVKFICDTLFKRNKKGKLSAFDQQQWKQLLSQLPWRNSDLQLIQSSNLLRPYQYSPRFKYLFNLESHSDAARAASTIRSEVCKNVLSPDYFSDRECCQFILRIMNQTGFPQASELLLRALPWLGDATEANANIQLYVTRVKYLLVWLSKSQKSYKAFLSNKKWFPTNTNSLEYPTKVFRLNSCSLNPHFPNLLRTFH